MVRESREQRSELNQKFQETDRKFQETDRKFQETDRKFQETDQEIKETAREIKETAREIKETGQQIREMRKAFQDTDLQIKATDIKVKEVSTQIGNLGGKWGKFVEGLVAPACETLFSQRGIPVHQVSRQVKAKLPGGRQMEIDVFVVNTDAVALVEVKSTLTVESVREHLVRLAEFKEFFPVYADKRVIGAVAGIVIEENAGRFAINKGLFVIEQTGNILRMANDEAFVPRAW
ncbi:MAG: DUF3782 domain-containing protein [Nitrospirae bacterium]|nr:DUF3782 domain-containing protein [Magnetococcales bacterium]